MPKFIDLTGQRFGRYVALHRGVDWRPGNPAWVCRCDCGTEKTVRAASLRRGTTVSCGCYNSENKRAMCVERNTTHGMSGSREYIVWSNMVQRCHDPNSTNYSDYGGKGIAVCDRWRKFENFFADMGQKPSPKHTLDRSDSSLGYSPDNCRWATMKEQENNRTNNRRITFRGETLTLMQWAERTNLRREVIAARIDRLGWSAERALTTRPDQSTGWFQNRPFPSLRNTPKTA